MESTDKFIISHLEGGLGNQLFQYAVGFKLAKLNNADLFLDIKDYIKYPDRKYDLDHFCITGKTINPTFNFTLIDEKKNIFFKNKIRLICKLKGKKCVNYIKEPYYHYYPKLLISKSPCYIEGYWQSEKYFADIRDDLLKQFTPKSLISDESIRILNQIKKANAVSIHIRRGDYVTNQNTNAFHGLCSLEYYYRAIDVIKEKTKNPHFFIFSDEPVWAKDNLIFQDPATFVTHNPSESSYEDLFLMSKCSHHIIANSSFSWWGAWLAKPKTQIVITPEPWYNYSEYCYNDIIPERWIRIDK